MWLIFAICVAIIYGVRSIMFQWSSRKGFDRNLLLLGAYIGAFLLSVILNFFIGQAWNSGALLGIWIGAFAYVSNSSMYKAYAAGKASLIAILIGTSPLVVTSLSFLLWRETMSLGQGLAFLTIFSGVFLISYSNQLSWRHLQGSQWGLLAMLFFGMTDILCKISVLQGAETLPTLILMFGTGAILFCATWRWQQSKERGRTDRSEHPHAGGNGKVIEAATPATHRTLLWGMTIGLTNFLAMIFILPAFKLGVTGLVSAIISGNILLIVLYARVVLKEKMAQTEMLGIALIFGGVIAIKLLS
ncbi:EamA-like transporter family protein [compost metagenome]